MTSNTALLESFKHSYQDLLETDWSQLSLIYAEDVLFKDPVHEIRGLVTLEDYLIDLCSEILECRFEYLDQIANSQAAYIKWVMHFRHPRLGSKLINIRGVSHLKWSDKIDFHEDFYDMGAMLYDHVPLVGNATRWLKQRLSAKPLEFDLCKTKIKI
jgi:esterase/lipase superfamily enzyme